MSEYQFDLSGGTECLDFSNTMGAHASDAPNEHLHSYEDLVSWGRQAKIVTERQAQRLLREAARHPAQATAVLTQAVLLRETIYRIFSAIAATRLPHRDDLDALNAALPEALTRLRVSRSAKGFVWSWAIEEEALDWILWPVVRSAAELLTSDELGRLRECANETCGWLFLDRSKNQSRRWCDMKSCGNLAKARRYYQRHTRNAH
jgi:predicted RNA-binding Zn ribbon-like protein